VNKEQVSIDDIIERYPGRPEYLIFLLQDLQNAYNYISPAALTLVCDHVGVPLSHAYAVATFYQSFSLEPKGEHECRVCSGTACHLKGAARVVEEVERKLGIKAGQTTKDLKFTLETVNCLGACALAPVAVIDEEYHPNVTTRQLLKNLDKLAAE
jgi:NADH-quinone oxidoreductase subunit E